jgi:anaerobic selenocysteine-containing dehydrogenase
MVAAAGGRIRAGVLLGGNLFASNPDRAWAAAALARIPLVVSITTKLNEGHVHGRGRTSLLLPVLARDEEREWTTQESMFNYVRISEGGNAPVPGELRSEVDVIASLAERILPEARLPEARFPEARLPEQRFDWSRLRSHRRLREEIARVVPGYEAIGEVDRGRAEFAVGGRTFHEPRFPTPDGRARFHVTPLPDLALPDGAFRLMTLRSEGQFNTVVYEEEDLYRGNRRRDIVMMSPEDASRLALKEGEHVRVETETGSLAVSVALVPIRPGNLAMYYPEANRLVPRRLDPRSGTPAFKSVEARIRPASPRRAS